MLLFKKRINSLYLILSICIFSSSFSFGQITATFTKTINTICDGSDCSYSGPSILINELMITPASNDGCLSGTFSGGACRGEWIELYNPNICEPVDISCYYLGNNTAEGTGGYTIPAGTIIPAGGFCMIRGENAAAVPTNLLVASGGNVVELIVSGTVGSSGVCAGGSRLWFPNGGGWFAFYDQNGVAQDAVSWGPMTGGNPSNGSGSPCVAALSGCNTAGMTLSNYNSIVAARKNVIGTGGALWAPTTNQTFRRLPDGGTWSGQGTATFATCNSVCATQGVSTCDGTATVTPSGGTGPYTYVWNDSQAQMTQTAIGLCEGFYDVIVTDANSVTATFTVEITNFVPTVTLDIINEICIDATPFAITGALPVPGAGQLGVYSGAGVTAGNFDPAAAGVGMHVITYVFTDENSCVNDVTGIDSIRVNPLPTPTITNFAAQYCVTASDITPTLTPTGGTFSGTGVVGSQFSPSTAGVGPHTMSYTYTDGNGCTNTTTEQITVNPLPVVTISGIAPTYCLSNTPVTLNLSPTGGTLSGPGVTNNQFIPSAAGVGTHTLTYVASDANSCENTTTATITVVASPAPTFSIQPIICDYAVAIPLTASPTGGSFALNGNSITEFNPVTAGAGSHTIIYTYTDVNTCIGMASASIQVVPRPTLASSLLPVYCFQTPNVTLNFTPAGGTATGSLLTGNTLGISNAIPGTYQIEYTYADNNGCENTMDQSFVVTSPIYPEFTSATDCFQNQSFFNFTVPVGNYQYAWNVIDGPTSTAVNPSIYFPVFGDHNVQLTVTDSYNCSYDTIQSIYVDEGVSPAAFEIPNVITPNGDGINDYLQLTALMETCLDYKILILNRWGNVVYEMKGNNNAFGGVDKGGKDLSEGVYFYTIESDMIDCKSAEYKGFCSGIIHIVR